MGFIVRRLVLIFSLIGAINCIAYTVATEGTQTIAALVGGALVGIFVAVIDPVQG